MASFMYERVRLIIQKPSAERTNEDVKLVEPWFRKKSKLFEGLNTDVLSDLVKHCDFLGVRKDHVIINQGEKGRGFFIILSGKVSVYIKELMDENALRDQNVKPETDRNKLGTNISSMGDGQTFGELALINDDCVRTASVVADVPTDLIVIHRDLYNRSVGRLVNQDFEEKLAFIDHSPLFKLWPNKWKKHLAVALLRDARHHDDVIFRQGDSSKYIYFLLSGEIKLVCDPEVHNDNFQEFMQKCAREFDIEDERIGVHTEYFSLANWVSAKSRTADRLRSAPGSKAAGADDGKVLSVDLPEFKLIQSPSMVRKAQAHRAHKDKVNICFLEAGNTLGDVEFLLNLQVYHATAKCTQACQYFYIHRAIFDRLFRKKNPHTLKIMSRNMGVQFLKRSSRTKLNQDVPLLKYITCKVQELNGERAARRVVRDDEGHYLPQVDTQSVRTTKSRPARIKSGYSSRSHPVKRATKKVPDGVFRAPTAFGGGGGGGAAGFQTSTLGGGGYQSDGETTPGRTEPDLPNIGAAYDSGYESSTTPHGVGVSRAAEFAVSLPTPSAGLPSGLQHALPGPAEGGAMVEVISECSTPENPREGIFLKLMQVSNPMVDPRYLDMEEDEYQYLLQLRRRLAKQMQDFYPAAQQPERAGTRGEGARPARRGGGGGQVSQSLPTIRGAANSPRKTAMKSSRDEKARGKNVLFSLPKFS